MSISSPGIGSGLDVNGIVSKLMTVESQPLTQLATKEASYQAQLTAYGSLQSALGTFQSAMSNMSSLAQFQSLTATSADTTVFNASATSTAVPGNYSVNVSTLAQSQSITTATGQANTSSAIGGAGPTTLTFKFGTISGGTLVNGVYNPGASFVQDTTQATGTVTIDSTNNSLLGIRDAINNANMGVTATIVNDGTATTPYQLVLTSNKTGATSSMQISASGDATVAGLLAYDPTNAAGQMMHQTQVAQNASLTVNGLSITSATNTLTSAIPGVTLSLLKPSATSTTNTSLTVAHDTAGVQNAVQNFVNAYNTLNTTLNQLTAYDPTTKQAGPLQGDYMVTMIQSQVRRALSTPLAGLSGSLTSLYQVGVSFQKDGSLALDSTKLQSAISSNFSDIAGLFSSIGKATDSLVNFVGSTNNTSPGSYSVNVSSMATQGYVTGLQAVGALVIDNTNNTISVNLNGTVATVTIPSQTYATASALATALQTAINTTSSFSALGYGVTVSANVSNVLTITSNTYGSASNVSVTGNGAANLLGNGPTSYAGTDVVGTINGNSATGSGQNLTGLTGSPTEGLQVQITGGSAGSRGMINFSRGYAYNLNGYMTSILAGSGLVASRTAGINKTIKDLQSQQTQMQQHLTLVEASYRAQFTNLDVMMGQMTQTSSYLTQQLASLSNLSKSTK